MAEKNYQKRELDYYFTELKDHLGKQDNTLLSIEAQTMKTNGRVNKLEWRDRAFIWALGAVWTLLLLGVPIGYMVLRYVVLNEIDKTSASSATKAVADFMKNYQPLVKINEN